MTKIFGWTIGKKHKGEVTKSGKYYRFFNNGILLARFDSEEKARLYFDAFEKGIELESSLSHDWSLKK
jgi:hypothetical protein